LLLGVAVAVVGAESESRVAGERAKTVVLDNETIQPDRVEIRQGDPLVFENHSVHPMAIAFVEPEHLEDRIGKLVGPGRETAGAPAGVPFRWEGGKLTAVVPPGRYAAVPVLPPGRYGYIARNVDARIREEGGAGGLSQKGQVVVTEAAKPKPPG
jgi:hypothetical protein